MNKITSREKFVKWLSEIRFPDADFLEREPSDILNTIKQWVKDPTSQSWNVNWLLIGEVARSKIYHDADNELIWAEIGALAYEYYTNVEKEYPDASVRYHIRNDNWDTAMRLRTDAVIKYGNQSDGSVRDVRKIIEWGLNRSLTLQQAQAVLEDESRTADDKGLFICDLVRTRALLKLSEAGMFERDKSLNDWAKIVDAWLRYLAQPSQSRSETA